MSHFSVLVLTPPDCEDRMAEVERKLARRTWPSRRARSGTWPGRRCGRSTGARSTRRAHEQAGVQLVLPVIRWTEAA